MINRVLKYQGLTRNIVKLRQCSTQEAIKKPAFSTPQILNLNQGSKFSPGKVYEGFLCTKVEHIKDFNMTAYLFKHESVGTEYLHIDRNDSNNLFSINFRTTPFDSTGVPHILEHNVLCGSVKYPVRDPFFKMLTRSVASFMNAMTGPDYTIYPFSSTNETDFRNLQKIYLDAVFHPNLRYIDFLQEGWRLEHTDITNKKSDYIIKGVVYNEMKGAFSENSNVFGQHLLNKILPDHTYGYVSGGDPKDIPNLTHTNLVKFHEKYYHPSNSRFLSYGNNKLEPTLNYLNEAYMKDYMKIDTDYSKIPAQSRWSTPKSETVTCRFDNMGAPIERQNQIAIAYLASDVTDIYETFVMTVLTELLVRGPNSFFYKRLIEPNISGGYSPHTGFDNQVKDTLFVLGLQDIKIEDFGRVEEIFNRTIDEVVEKGFNKNHIESVLNNFELQLRHQTPKFGLNILFNLTPIWNHDGDVFAAMKVSELISRLRNSLAANPKYLQEKVNFYFRHNQHKLILKMTPDKDYEEKLIKAENDVLAQKIEKLTEDDKDKIYRDGIILSDVQKVKENTDCLPCLKLDDIPKKLNTTPVYHARINQIPTQFNSTDTNGVTYYRGIFNVKSLSNEQKILLPLFVQMINQFGTNNYSYQQFDQEVLSKTSGLSFTLHLTENILNNKEYEIGVFVGSYCLSKNIQDMFNLMGEIIINHKMIDVNRFKMLLENYMSDLSIGIANSGHMYAMQSASGLVSDSGKLKESLVGIEHIAVMKALIQNNSPEEILKQLREIAENVFNRSQLRSVINHEESIKCEVEKIYSNFITSLPLKDAEISKWNISNVLKSSNLQHVMNIPVNYCAKSIFTVPYTSSDYAPLKVLAKILSAKYLLPVVREQNGAYGAGAKISNDGVFSFFSYRDPNSLKTLEAFDGSGEWITENLPKFEDQILFEAKLGVIQQLDMPIGPGDIGIDEFKYGLSQSVFNDHRDRILTTTKEQLEEVNLKYLKNADLTTGKCILGPEIKDLHERNDETWIINKSE